MEGHLTRIHCTIRIDSQTGLSDHRSFYCTIAKNKIENGPGYWRFNNQLLENPEILIGMTHRIRQKNYVKQELPHDITDQQLTEALSILLPPLINGHGPLWFKSLHNKIYSK